MRGRRLSIVATAVGSAVLVPVLPLFLLSRGFTLTALAGFAALPIAAALLAQALARRAPDAWSRPGALVALHAAPALLTAGLLLAQSGVHYILLMTALAVVLTLAALGLATWRARVVPPGSEPRAWLTGASYAAGLVLGGILGSQALAWAFLAAAAFHLVGALGVAWSVSMDAHVDARSPALHLQRATADLVGGFRIPRAGHVNVSAALAHAALFSLSLGVFPFYLPLYLHLQGVPVVLIGGVLAAGWIVFLAAKPLGRRLVRPRRPLTLALLPALGAAAAAIGLLPVALACAAWLALSLLDGLTRPALQGVVNRAAPFPYSARAMVLLARTTAWARIAAPFVFIAAVLLGGFRSAFLLAGALAAASVLPLLLFTPVGAPAPRAQESAEISPPSGVPA